MNTRTIVIAYKELLQLKLDSDRAQAESVARIRAEAMVKVAELRATGAPSTLTPEQARAAEDDDGDDGEGNESNEGDQTAAPAPTPAPALAPKPAPKPKKRVISYDRHPETGKLLGASLNGKPFATVTRDASGRMTGAELAGGGAQA